MSSRLPALGPRGEGWVVAQVVLFTVAAAAGLRDLVGHGSGSPWGPALSLAGLVAIVVGGLVAGRAVWNLRASLNPFPRPIAGAPLIESGAYRLVRHPIYSGLVLGAFGLGTGYGLDHRDRDGGPACFPTGARPVLVGRVLGIVDEQVRAGGQIMA